MACIDAFGQVAQNQRKCALLIRQMACTHILCVKIETSTIFIKKIKKTRKNIKKKLAKYFSLKYNGQARAKTEVLLCVKRKAKTLGGKNGRHTEDPDQVKSI